MNDLRRSPALVPIVLIVLWLVASWADVIDPLFLPTFASFVAAFMRLLSDTELAWHLAMTTYRTVVGFALAALIGVPIGLLLGLSPRAYRMFSPVIDFLRSIPGTALFPVFLLLFGVGDEAKIANVVFAGALIMVVNTVYGVRNVHESQIQAARTMGASQYQIYTLVILPAALPAIVGGLRIASSIALIVVVVTEMFVGTSLGLGRLIFRSYELFRIPEMYVGIFIAGMLGYSLNGLLLRMERRWLHWSGK